MKVSFITMGRILALGFVYSLLLTLLIVLAEDTHARHIDGERSAVGTHTHP